MGVKLKGFDEFGKQLDRMTKKAKQLERRKSLPLGDLLNDSFMQRTTQFSNLDDMFEKSPFDIKSAKDFDAIPELQLDEFIRNNSNFSSWEDMLEAAIGEWLGKQLGF